MCNIIYIYKYIYIYIFHKPPDILLKYYYTIYRSYYSTSTIVVTHACADMLTSLTGIRGGDDDRCQPPEA